MIRSKQKWVLRKSDMETNTGKSLTVQDDTMSIKDILDRYTRGIEPPVRAGEFLDNDDHDDIDLEKLGRADVTEKFSIHKEQVEKVIEAKKRVKQAREKREKEEKDKTPKTE